MKSLIKRSPSFSIFAALLITAGVLVAGNLSYSPSAPQTTDSDKIMLQKSFVDIHSLATNGIANSSLYAAPGATPASSPAQGLFVQPLPGATPFSITATTPIPATITQKQLTGTPSTFTPATADGTVFTLAAGEVGFIQNLSADAPMAVKKGASASTSSFNFGLAAGSAIDDFKGGAVRIDDWVGAVSVAKIGSGTARYIAWKQAP